VPGWDRSLSISASLSRELQALGHTVRLMPPSYVKAYLKRSKNDANDAAAICEAVEHEFVMSAGLKSNGAEPVRRALVPNPLPCTHPLSFSAKASAICPPL